MANSLQQTEYDPELIQRLRERALQGAGVRDMVQTIHSTLGYPENAVVPVLSYFTQAFHVRLTEVLPIREWMGTNADKEIDELILPAIERTKPQWEQDDAARRGSAS